MIQKVVNLLELAHGGSERTRVHQQSSDFNISINFVKYGHPRRRHCLCTRYLTDSANMIKFSFRLFIWFPIAWRNCVVGLGFKQLFWF